MNIDISPITKISDFLLELGKLGGLFSFCYLVYKDFLLQPIIKGKVIRLIAVTLDYCFNYQNINSGNFETISGIFYSFQISLICLNKTFDLKKIEVDVHYKNDNKVYEGTILFNYNLGRFFGKELRLPSSDCICFINVLEKDKSGVYYLAFVVQKSLNDTVKEKIDNSDEKNRLETIVNEAMFESIKMKFFDFNNKCKILKLSSDDIDSRIGYYDDSLFHDIQYPPNKSSATTIFPINFLKNLNP